MTELPSPQNIARLKTVRVLSRRYRIILTDPPDLDHNRVRYGEVNNAERIIYLNPLYRDNIIATLWHEIIHIIDDELHIADDYRKDDEALCHRMGYSLSTVKFTYSPLP